jgi:quercetin dioxygenase-like cupin family protein
MRKKSYEGNAMSHVQDEKLFVVADEKLWVRADPGVRRMVLGYDATLMLVRVEFEKGAEGYMHSHHHRQVTYIVSGAFEVRIDDDKRVLNSGDSFVVPPDVSHGVIALEAGTVVDAFTPARQDFIDMKQKQP